MQIHYKTFFRIIITGLIFFNLTACGFHLRGQNELPPALHTVYLQTDNPYGQFESTLKQTLISAGVVMVDSPRAAPVTLSISKPVLANSMSTLGASNQTRVYTVVYTVTFSLMNAQGKVLFPATPITSTRSLTLSANQLLDSNSQLTLLEQEMQRDVIDQLYNRLMSQQIAQVLNNRQ